MIKDKSYCLYTHTNSTGEVMYVGSGRIYRANQTFAKSGRGKNYENYVNNNGRLNVQIIERNLSKDLALTLEASYFISHFSERLLNHRKPNKVNVMPSKSMLDELVEYSESSVSCLFWKKDVSCGKVKAGSVAGTFNKSNGYWQVQIEGVKYQAHRVVAVLQGLDTTAFIDHINGDRSDNKITNLRVVSQGGNMRNRTRSERKTEAPLGVKFNARFRHFIAQADNPMLLDKHGKGRRATKTFSVKQYGYSEALRLAVAARAEMIRALERIDGIAYSDRHLEI